MIVDVEKKVRRINPSGQRRFVLIYRLEQYRWLAQCLSLPGCSCEGETKSEVLTGIYAEIDAYLQELARRNLPIPEDIFDAAVIEIK